MKEKVIINIVTMIIHISFLFTNVVHKFCLVTQVSEWSSGVVRLDLGSIFTSSKWNDKTYCTTKNFFFLEGPN